MRDKSEQKPGQAQGAWPQGMAGETLLRSEITFWRELLASSDGCQPVEAVDRMRQALALAEYRLLSLYRSAH
jgi:hypothetical protein